MPQRLPSRPDTRMYLIAHPHLLVPGHQRTVSTSKGCNQWLSLAKTLRKVALDGGNRSLVARTSKCGWAIRSKSPLHIGALFTHTTICCYCYSRGNRVVRPWLCSWKNTILHYSYSSREIICLAREPTQVSCFTMWGSFGKFSFEVDKKRCKSDKRQSYDIAIAVGLWNRRCRGGRQLGCNNKVKGSFFVVLLCFSLVRFARQSVSN